MPQSLAKVYAHIIFSTKDRMPWIKRNIKHELEAYLTGILRKQGCCVLTAAAMKDHVHILCELSRTLPVSKMMEELKSSSSKWIKRKKGINPGFQWQRGYGIFSVSPSLVEKTKKYARDQEEHHKKRTFREEFLGFLRKYNVTYDDRYLWD